MTFGSSLPILKLYLENLPTFFPFKGTFFNKAGPNKDCFFAVVTGFEHKKISAKKVKDKKQY